MARLKHRGAYHRAHLEGEGWAFQQRQWHYSRDGVTLCQKKLTDRRNMRLELELPDRVNRCNRCQCLKLAEEAQDAQ